MAIFAFIAVEILAVGAAGSFAAVATASALALATGIALNYVAQALAGTPQEAINKDNFSTQGRLAAGGDVPRSFGLGKHMTAGSLVYANYWGQSGETPNAYITQVIAVSDLPREQLLEVWISGEKVTLSGPVDANMGQSVAEYHSDGATVGIGGRTIPHLWIKYYNGTQTAADTFLTGTVSSVDRPYGSTRIGTGICYVIATALVEDKLFSGFPTFKFVMSGIPLYDPSKDSTNGGSGSHLYSNPATWGGDGDQLPAVQAYNVLRGIKYGSAWLYGLQNMAGPARLPAANWNAQIAKCRATITGEAGLEPTYRSGGQVNVNSQPANLLEALLTACQGRLSEIGGFYKIHLGAPDSPTFSWTDADLLSSEQQTYRPFFSLADSVNGIQGTYPSPDEGWETATAPPLYRTDLELRDGSRRLMAAPSFDFVPYAAQVQRLQKSGLEEAQRARTHVLPMPPAYWVVEPGDVGSWTSFRNGYEDKLFRVDSVADQPNLDCVFNVTEIDPSDYDWSHAVDYTGVATGPTVIPRPEPQGVVDWYAEGTTLLDADGFSRRPAIRIAWDGSLAGVVGIQYEVRLTFDLSHVTRGRTDQLEAGALLISQGIIEETAYQVRGQYLPSSPRDMLWSDWLDVTTPAVEPTDIPAWITVQVTEVMDYLADRQVELEQRIATLTSKLAAQEYEEIKSVRSQLTARSEAAFAEISHVETVSIAADAAMAESIDTVTARVDVAEDDINAAEANIILNATAIANTEAAFADYTVTTNASIGNINASVTTQSTAIVTINGWAAAQYAVTLDVNGYATGFEFVNGGAGFSTATFVQDKFQVAAPGVGGGAAVPIFTVANVGGAAKVAIRGDMYADGTIYGSRMVAGSINSDRIEANTITADRLLTNTITSDSGKIGALSLKSLSIGNNAVTVPVAASYSALVGTSNVTLATFNVAIDTTGLAGQTLGLYAIGTVVVNSFGTGNTWTSYLQMAIPSPTNVQVAQTTNVNGISHTLSYNHSFTADGGVMNFTVSLIAAAAVAAAGFTATGSLYALATKR